MFGFMKKNKPIVQEAPIFIKVVGSTFTGTKIDLDRGPLRMTYPMDTPGKRTFAYNKYYRWFWNSVNFNKAPVMDALNDIVEQAIKDGEVNLSSMHHFHKCHLDIIVEYLSYTIRGMKKSNNQNYVVSIVRTEPIL